MNFIKNHKVQLLALFLSLTMISMISYGYSNVESINAEAAYLETSTIQVSFGNDMGNENVEDGYWDENDAVKVTFNGNAAQISAPLATFSGGILTINRAGTYVLSGRLENGQIMINAGKNDVVRLVLNNVSLHNENGPAIYAPKSSEVVLILEKGTQNTISDGFAYALLESGDDPSAAIYVQNNLSIAGSGTLNVIGNYKHGIRAQDFLKITNGVINVNASGDALRGRDGVIIQGGEFALKAEGDGIQSNNDKDGTVGFVTISGGTFLIQAKNDGIQAESGLTVTGGYFDITTGGGSANVSARTNNFFGGGGMFGGRQPSSPNSNVTSVESVSMKGLKAGKQLNIMGGEFVIDAEDDGVHSNENVLITSGKLLIKTGDDGIHADVAVEITGGEISIPVCYEGIEGMTVTIKGGNIFVVSRDDAINAANGEGKSNQTGGMMRFGVSQNDFIRISGGNIELFAQTDGLDSNGNIFIEGGTLKISGPSAGMEGAIDADGTVLITGGELITAGSIANTSTSSTQPVLIVYYTRQQVSGSVIEIKDAAGNVLLEYTSRNAYTTSGFTSSSFEIGKKYSLFVDGQKRGDITLSSVITTVSDDGSPYNTGRNSMGGMNVPFNGGGNTPGNMPGGNRW